MPISFWEDALHILKIEEDRAKQINHLQVNACKQIIHMAWLHGIYMGDTFIAETIQQESLYSLYMQLDRFNKVMAQTFTGS